MTRRLRVPRGRVVAAAGLCAVLSAAGIPATASAVSGAGAMSRQIATSQLTMDDGVPCAAQAQTVRIRTLRQVHASAVTDPRGNDVRVEFRMKHGSSVLWESGLSTAKPSGSSFAASVPASLPKEASLHWEARSRAGGRYGPWSSAGPQSACHFVWDTTAPAEPVISSAEYPESAPANPVDPWRDGVGQYGWFTLTAADPDVTAYRYGVNGSPDTLIAVHDGAPVTVPVLPEKSGLHFLTAQAIDAAGNASEVRTYQYRVAEGRPERALWPMDDPAGSPQAVAREVSRTAALHGGAALAAAGVEGGALSLDGVDGHAETPRPLVDTHHDFSVSAWAQVTDKPDGPAVVAAQAGNELAGFELSYAGDVDRWAFGHAAEDRAGSDTVRAMADGPGDAQEGEWAHLVGVYDAADEALRLYVDGQLAGETRHRITWNARGPFTVGAHSHAGLLGGHFAGVVDELQVYDRSLTHDEISTLFAGGSPVREPLAVLSFEEPETARATVARGQARAALLHGGATTGAPGVVDGSLTLDGVTGFAQAGAAQLNTARSYSVSAWAHLDAEASAAGALLSQAGAQRPAFELAYSADHGRWVFSTHAADDAEAARAEAVQPADATDPRGDWAHLVAVQDTVANTLTLYVNGERAAVTEAEGRFAAAGPLLIGAAEHDGVITRHFPGQIDEVRLYDRVVTAHEAERMFSEVPPPNAVQRVNARWKFEEGDLTTPNEVSENGFRNDLTLGGDTAFGFGWVDDDALYLDGETGYAMTATVPVDTSGSFTLAGFAQAHSLWDEPMTAFSTVGDAANAFAVRFVPYDNDPGWGYWEVTFADSDAVDAEVARVVHDSGQQAYEWTHLAVVHDGSTGRVELYVNGELTHQSVADRVPTFRADHSLQVGRSRIADGTWGEHWHGAIDDLWVFEGALNDAQIYRLSRGISGMPTEVPFG